MAVLSDNFPLPREYKNNGQLFWGHPLKDVLFSSLDKWEVIYSHNQSKSFCNYCNDKLHNEGFRLNLYSIPNRPIV